MTFTATGTAGAPTQIAIDAPALTLGTPTAGTLTTGQAAYYKGLVGYLDPTTIAVTSTSASIAAVKRVDSLMP